MPKAPAVLGADVETVATKAKEMIAAIINDLSKAGSAGDPRLFFPEGIWFMKFEVEVTPIKVAVEISGRKANDSVKDLAAEELAEQ